MNTQKMISVGAVPRLITLFILLASLLVLPKTHAAVGNTFTIDQLKYTVLTEEPGSQTGTVSVQAESTEISGNITIPTSVVNGDNNYSVTSIPNEAFRNCTSLTGITIPDSVISIGKWTFYRCSSLASVTMGNSVTEIGYMTFSGCTSLSSIIIPDSVTSIGDEAFWGCNSLTSITIPDSVTSIGDYALAGSSSMMDIIVRENNPKYSSLGGVFFNKDQTTLIQYPNVKNGAYTVPDSVTSICQLAFYQCSLTSIVISDSVTFIGYEAFSGSSSLTGVYFEGNAPSIQVNAFSEPSIIYYKPGTTGWTNPWDGRPTTLWIESPEITEQPQSQSVMKGDSVTFGVVAKGTEPLSYQWYKEGVAIENATGTSYTIESASAEDRGNYTVTVSNESGEVTSTVATLTLKIPYRATGTVQVVDGSVVGLTVTDGGWGYTQTPKIRIKDETGSGATGHCVIENGVVTQIILDNPGSNYSEEATILIGSPIGNSSLEIAFSEVKVKMHLILGMEYQLWSSVDCINWEQVGEPFTADEEEMDLWFKIENYGRFFKLQEI